MVMEKETIGYINVNIFILIKNLNYFIYFP